MDLIWSVILILCLPVDLKLCLHITTSFELVTFHANRTAVTAMAERHADGSLPLEDFNIEVEDQSGQKVRLGSETDQRYKPLWHFHASRWN